MSEVKSNRAWRLECAALRAELLGYQEEAQIHGKNIELRDTEITRLRAELTHEKGLREQAEAICVVLRAHREEYAAQVIEGHAEIANITADNKRLRAELAECKTELALHKTPNLLWDFDEPENSSTDSLHDAVIQEVEFRGDIAVGEELAFLAARKLPNITVRITSYSEDGEVTFDVVDAALAADGEAK